ncbi:MAG: ATP-dependent DNA helicase [Candidatus Omnitrophota bacterium]
MTQALKLNKEQNIAVMELDGPLLVMAGPGTGKTQLLSLRTASIMQKRDVPGENILILTYTNAGAKSIKERLAKIVGFEGYKIAAETFHGFANSIILDSEEATEHLRERIQISALEKVKCFEYIVDHFTDEIKELRPFGYPYLYIKEIAKRISDLKNEGILPDEFNSALESVKPDGIHVEKKHIARLRELAFIYKKYEELKTGTDENVFDERGRYDFDDMIMIAVNILQKESALRLAAREKYKYIMVDEFQDTNGAQLKLLFLLCDEKRPNLCCVGDDDQSIYRFQGASVANFKILKERFPDIRVVKLKNNYRSTREIIDVSSRIIKSIPDKERMDPAKFLVPQEHSPVSGSERLSGQKRIEFTKLSTEDEEVIYITSMIDEVKRSIEKSQRSGSEEKAKPYNQIAVFARKRSQILKIIDSFLGKGIPYATDGKEDISHQKRVKQMIDVLELARTKVDDVSEKDLALYRVLSCDFFSIPQRTILKFINYVNAEKRKRSTNIFSEFITAFRIDDLSARPTPPQTRKLGIVKELSLDNADRMHSASWAIQRALRDADTRPVHDLLMGFVEDAGLYKFIMKTYEESRILMTRDLRALTSFINMVKNMSLSRPDLTLTGFLEELETMRTHKMPLEGELVTATQDGVRIITAHASKGLEFHSCFIPFCVQDKSWPLKHLAERIPLPPSVVKTKESVKSKQELARLSFFDETRLFYVASSRARRDLFFTASPTENTIVSSYLNDLKGPVEKKAADEIETLKHFFKKGEKEDPFKSSKEVLRDLVKNFTLTPTKLNNYLKCKRRFLYDNLLLLPGRKKQSLVFGNCTHKALEDTYRIYKKERRFPDFSLFSESFTRELRLQGVNKAIEKACLAKLNDLSGWFKERKKRPVLPIDLEKKKIITLKGGIVFTGKFDKIEFEDEKKGHIRVIDYKTGKPDAHLKRLAGEHDLMSEECDDYLRQLVAYKMLYERDTYERTKYIVTHGVLVFLEQTKSAVLKYNIRKGEYVDKKVEITGEMTAELEGVISRTWKKISDLEFEKLPERDYKKCNNCTYDSICWE